MHALKKMIAVTIVALVSVFVFVGCEEEEQVKTLDKDTAVQTLETNSQELEASMKEMENSEGMKVLSTLDSLMRLDDPFSEADIKAFRNEFIVSSLRASMKPTPVREAKRLGNDPFDFENRTGTYTWQAEGKWHYAQQESSDTILFEFPSDSAQETNNATLILTEYSEIETKDTANNTIHLPARIKANLYENSEEVGNIDYTMVYNDNNDMVTSLEADVFLKPYTWDIDFNQNTIAGTLQKNRQETPILSFSFDITFMDNLQDIKKLQGNLRLHDMNFKGWIEPYELEQLEDDDFWEEQGWKTMDDALEYANNQFDIALYQFSSNDKLADLKIVSRAEEDEASDMAVDVVFVFKDGSTKSAEEVFDNIVGYLQNMMNRYSIPQS